ncbi:MAG: hypothetical protein R3C32_07820 [Chloroflexota bacterium]
MTSASDLREFLTTRRARLSPSSPGCPPTDATGACRWLRREEVALLAGIGIDYYTRLERATPKGCQKRAGGRGACAAARRRRAGAPP